MLLINIFTVVLLVPVLVESLEPALNDDVLGLIVFKADLVDPDAKLSSWNEDDENPCNWVGVKCYPRTSRRSFNRVSELLLTNFYLSGHIGTKSLLSLSFLSLLSLSNNNFTGSISPLLSQLESLRFLDLSQNGLSGPIPREFFQQCTKSLRAVSFANNYLTGSLPDSLSSCSSLETLNLSSNQLSGQLPSGLWFLSSLRSLDLSDNQFEGEIPMGVENSFALKAINLSQNKLTGLLPQNIGNCMLLRTIDFADNFLYGSLPESMRKLGFCTSLSLGGNSLTGEIPEWIADMKSLEIIDISANNFSGLISNSLGSLRSLKEMNLSKNVLTGRLPESLLNCVNLMSLDVDHNLLTGGFPSWIFKLELKRISLSGNRLTGTVEFPPTATASYGTLQVLDLSFNLLSGEIPFIVGNFGSLQVLNLSSNSLTGSIPASVGRLNTTLVIDFSHNQLNGSIPSDIGGAVSLQVLRLENNFLTGIVPTGIENCSSLTSLDLSRNNFTGPIPAAFSNLTNLESIDLSINQFNGSLPKQLTNLSHLSTFNVSYNHLQGVLPVGGFFNTIPASSVAGNPSLCGSVVKHACSDVHNKPIVLDPHSSDSSHGSLSSDILHKRIVLSISSFIAIGAGVFIALGVVTVSILNLLARASMENSAAAPKKSGGDDFSHSHSTTEANYGKLVMFSGHADFTSGTQALLNKDCELGRAGFGAVYRTNTKEGSFVAIKKLNLSCLIKSREIFEREIKELGQISHPNLVALLGYYWSPSLQLLINEYICGGSLYKHIHEGQSKSCLSWEERFNIVLGTAKGLAHLHQLNIIHYNIKSTNVLIDGSGDPKLGDFGLARLLLVLDRYTLSRKTQSALGYMAPEFACQTVKITEKCDVYGFGILTLEVVTGKRPAEYMEDDVVVLCDLVRRALDEGSVEECIDHNLHGNYPVEEAIPVVKLGLICASQVPSNRPDMEEFVLMHKNFFIFASPSIPPHVGNNCFTLLGQK
ncbi:hypothetical protein ACH5RR_005121 [Cinchona calisaya]|uniref:Protein kinase domain-containing protein n=1 Tax=Cinchona calisaya TaxID=153742 RepID=A0ABD3AK95_9GENT